MTTIIPELTDAQLAELPSQAEAKVYRALRDGLPRDFVVFFQVGWILRREEEQAKDGETDFVVCHPDLGYETPYGTIEFTHTKRRPAELIERTVTVKGRPLRIATKQAAVADLVRAGRNTNMIDMKEFADV